MELTADEQLALLVAYKKKLEPIVKDHEGIARQALLELCGETGCDRRPIVIDGEKVGEVGVSFTKAQAIIDPSREGEALDFLEQFGLVEKVPAKGWHDAFARVGNDVVHKESGEICPFLMWQERVAKSASIRGCKPEDVLQAFHGKLNPGQELTRLLGDGADA